jgi:ribulose-5-phosphate 4-epimerase/fuculose-1-phosphate aldolase
MDTHIAPDHPLTGIDVYAMPPEQGEWVLRRQLAAAYRLVDHFGWTELIYGHLTARVPGEAAHFLINPFGLNYDEVTASNLVKIDVDGNVIGEARHAVNYAGFVIHSAIHMAHQAKHRVVMHTHTRAGMAVAATKEGLMPISMNATAVHGAVA